MKIYFHINLEGFSNCYVVANEKNHKAFIIDPGRLTESIINNIETDNYKLTDILVTHKHESHICGIKTIMKIYTPKIHAVDWEIEHYKTDILTGDGTFTAAGLKIKYFSLPGHTSDSMIYKIGNTIFTGDTISAGRIGSTSSNFSKQTLIKNIKTKIYSQTDETILLPGHGPPTTVGAEKIYNYYIDPKIYTQRETSQTLPADSPHFENT